MSVVNTYQNVAYSLGSPTVGVPAYPVISPRAPTVNDKAPFGQLWVDQVTNQVYFLTSISNNRALWVNPASEGGSGVFTSVEATTGNITADLGNIVATAGSVSAATTVSAGTSISSGTTITAGTGLTVTTGNAVISAGNITATLGNIVATAGSISAGTTITGTTGVVATSGNVNASTGMLVSGGVAASVGAGSIGYSGTVTTTQGVGALTIVSTGAGSHTNTGLIEIDVAGTLAYIPYFTNVS